MRKLSLLFLSLFAVLGFQMAQAQNVAKIGTVEYATLEEAFAAAQDGETITLLSDCAGNGIIAPQDKFATGLTVDFAGYTYTIDGSTLAGSTGTKTQAFQLLKGNAITFRNGAIVGNTTGLKMLIQNYSNLTLDNMVLDATQGTNSVGYVLSTNNGSTTIKDTQITAKTGGMAFDACSGWGNYQSNSVEVVGNSVINGDVEVSHLGRTPGQPATLTLTAGTLNGNIVMAQGADQCTVTKANTFTQDAPAGYVWQDNGNGTSTLAKAVAQIGTTKYATLEEAFAAAQDGETITLLSDCAGNGIKAPQGKFTTGLTVDFAGFTYTVDGETVGSTGTETNGFQLLKDNKITFQNGTITSTKAKILVQNYSDLTLNNMTLTLNNSGYTGAYTLSNNNGNTVIDGSTINANPAGGFAFDVCRYSSYPSVSVTVTGNSQINGNVEVYASNSDPKDGFKLLLESGTLTGDIVLDQTAKNVMESYPEKAEVTKNNTFNQTAPEGYMWQDNGNGTSTLAKAVAQIGTTNYATLEEAFAAAQDGETITLLANCAGNGIKVTPVGKFTTGLTVDFAGFTYTVDGETVGSTGTETNGFQLLKDNKITFQNGTITSTKAKILVQNYSDLTLNNMTLTLNNSGYTGAYTLSNNNGNIVIDGSTINANPAGGFAFDVCRYSSYRSVSVTVTGNSQINGDVEVSASKSDPKDGFKLLLESGTLTGDIVLDQTAKNAMESNPDKAEVTKNNTFNQTAPEGYEWRDNGDGTSTLVKSIVVLTLNETEDNSGVLEANNGKVADVTIGRSFVNTSYQTLSLPFDLTQEQVEAVFGTSTRVQSFTGAATDAEKNIVLNFTGATGIEAGKPYLILPFNNVENPTFTGVTVSNVAAQTVTGEQADFVANINATEYAANEQQMYLGADNKLYFNNTTATMKGFRAYFMLKGTAPGKTVGFSFDGTPTGITTITGNDNGNVNVNGWYTLDGQKLNAAPTQKGVYINNGRKVVVK